MPLEDQFHRGVCLFCGAEAKDERHSGSYETYPECKCAPSQAWWAARLELQNLERRAVVRLELMKAEEVLRTATQSAEGAQERIASARRQLKGLGKP